MKPTTKLIVCAFVALALTACKDEDILLLKGKIITNENSVNSNTGAGARSADVAYITTSLDIPHLKNGNVLVVHHAVINDKVSSKTEVNYAVEWDPVNTSQRWSCYKLYKNALAKNVERYTAENDGTMSPTCQYPNDQDIEDGLKLTVDPYKYSGYYHGHVCPSADRQGAYTANYQTFFMTNMLPQTSDFNGGVWGNMETQIRTWAGACDTLYVVKGGTIDKAENILEWVCGSSHQKTKVNAQHVPVPKYFFMAAMARKSNTFKAIGFWVNHEATDKDLTKYVKTIDELESLTGIDFFCNMDDDIEAEVQKSYGNLKTDWNLSK